MTSLVIGGSGVIGRSLCSALVKSGESVIATSRKLLQVPEMPGVKWRTLRLSRFEHWERLLAGVDTIYHLAWSTIPSSAVLDPAQDIADNVVGTVKMLEAARAGKSRIVFASSGGTIYGASTTLPNREDHQPRPLSAYGLSKLIVERYLDNYHAEWGLSSTSLRIANCYAVAQRAGGNLGAVTTFLKSALMKRPIAIFGDGSNIRDYIHVDDVVRAMMLAGRRRDVVGPLNIGSGRGCSLNELVCLIEQESSVPIKVERLEARSFDVPTSILDVSRARRELGWYPEIRLEEGITRISKELLKQSGDACGSSSSSIATFQATTMGRRPIHAP